MIGISRLSPVPTAVWAAVACASLLLLSACGQKEEAQEQPAAAPVQAADGTVEIPPSSPKLSQIRVDTVKTASIPEGEVVCPGKIEVNPNHVSRIVLPVTGRVHAVLVRIGDAVRQGQPLLLLDSPDADAAESAYLQAEAGLTQANANLVKAQSDDDRAKDLFEHSAVAQKDVLTADNALAQAKAAVEQARAAREQAVRRLDLLGLKPGQFGQRVVVRSPLAGKVLDLSVVAGEFRNDTNAPLMTIADLATVWVSADVPESSIRLIRVGEPLEVSLTAYPGQVFHARVTRLADTVDPQTRTVKVRAEMPNPGERFRPEMFGSMRHVESRRTLPVLPVGAVLRGEGRSTVFVERAPGRFQSVDVTTGDRYGDVVPVLSGVASGDRVVVDGAMLLKAQ